MPDEFEVVEDECIGCRLCVERAPGNLEIPDGSAAARVFRQPSTPEEEAACHEAAEYCPIGALKRSAARNGHSVANHVRPAFVPAGEPRPADATSMEMEN